jgi:hypothetical protein
VNIWFLLWVFLAIFILGLFFWSMQILLRQKKAWGAVASKHNMAFDKGNLTSSPSMRGSLKSFPLVVFSEEQTVNANGAKRFRTIIQFELPVRLGTAGVVASPDARNFANSLVLKETINSSDVKVNESVTIRGDDAELVKNYITEDRAKSLNAVMMINGIACIYIFDNNVTFLRFETPDAFDDEARLERFLLKAVDHVKVLV